MINYSATDYSYLDEGVGLTDPKQLRILKMLCNHLAQAPGFAPLKVYRGRAVVTAKEVQDCISVLEAPRSLFGDPAGGGGVFRSEQWALLIQGWPKDDPENPSDPAYFLKQAVEFQFASIVDNDDAYGRQRKDKLYLLNGMVSSIEIGQGIVRPANQESGQSRLAEFFIPLLLGIQTDKSQPN